MGTMPFFLLFYEAVNLKKVLGEIGMKCTFSMSVARFFFVFRGIEKKKLVQDCFIIFEMPDVTVVFIIKQFNMFKRVFI